MMTLVLLGAFIPLMGLLAAIIVDRERRKKSEKPPQSEKLLRPPGYSLSLRLEENAEKMLDELFVSCGFSAVAGIFVWMLVASFSNCTPPFGVTGSVTGLACAVNRP